MAGDVIAGRKSGVSLPRKRVRSLSPSPTPRVVTRHSNIESAPREGIAADASSDNIPDDKLRNPTIYRISKRLPQRPRGGRTDIYFTRASKPAGVSTRIRQLLDNDEVKNVTLHALGAAIKSCCDMALKFQSAFNVTLDVRTGTVEVFDDYVPLKANYPFVTRSRLKSAIHIRMIKQTKS